MLIPCSCSLSLSLSLTHTHTHTHTQLHTRTFLSILSCTHTHTLTHAHTFSLSLSFHHLCHHHHFLLFQIMGFLVSAPFSDFDGSAAFSSISAFQRSCRLSSKLNPLKANAFRLSSVRGAANQSLTSSHHFRLLSMNFSFSRFYQKERKSLNKSWLLIENKHFLKLTLSHSCFVRNGNFS